LTKHKTFVITYALRGDMYTYLVDYHNKKGCLMGEVPFLFPTQVVNFFIPVSSHRAEVISTKPEKEGEHGQSF
jgi:hypothetical protein